MLLEGKGFEASSWLPWFDLFCHAYRFIVFLLIISPLKLFIVHIFRGSRLFLQNGLFVVGPESAKAHPGPVCYRKNGYLAVTDANVVLGRVIPDFFPKIFGPNEDEPLDLDGAKAAFQALAGEEEAKGRTIEGAFFLLDVDVSTFKIL